jgi:cytochrome P450
MDSTILNRLRDIWGETAHEFRPERWLDPKGECKNGSGSPFGVYSNLWVKLNLQRQELISF